MAEAILGGFDDSFAPREEKVLKGRSHAAVIRARRQRLYRRQLEGLTVRQLVLDHASKESVCEKTA